MNVAYNSDCLAAMKDMPDNAFDLAVVDPPYGNGLPDNANGGGTGSDSVDDLTSTAQKMVNRGGWHGKHLYSNGTDLEDGSTGTKDGRGMEQRLRQHQKNYCVGHSAGGRIF